MKRKEKGIEGRKTWRGFKDENKDGMKGSKKGYKEDWNKDEVGITATCTVSHKSYIPYFKVLTFVQNTDPSLKP